MAELRDYEALLVEHHPFIRRTAARLCQRHGLDPDDTDEFVSWTTAKLVDNDYAVLRKFRGDSALTTFLTVVVSMLYRDFRVARWGRWRPSAEARRRGPDAVALETLIYRDGYGVSQAVTTLVLRGQTALSERELRDLAAALPMRPPGRLNDTSDHHLPNLRSDDTTDKSLIASESDAQREHIADVLSRALAALPAEDAMIVRLRFFENMSVATIARTLKLEQKPLYRRIERLLARMRGTLEAAGVSREQVADLLNEDEK